MSEALFGSNILPSTMYRPGGERVQLGDIVREAYRRSGLTISEWNHLPEEKRDEVLQIVVDEWGLK